MTKGAPEYIERYNREFAFVLMGAGHNILHETVDEEGRPVTRYLSEQAFHKFKAADRIQLGGNSKPQALSQVWINHPRRRTYQGVCFDPSERTPPGFYNLWRGFAVQGTGLDMDAAAAGCSIFLDHVRRNICRGEEDLFRWFIGWCAHIIQRPWEKPRVAVALRGGKGTGKTIVFEILGRLLGQHHLITGDGRFVTGRFNGHMERLLLLVSDEAFWSGDKAAEGVVKNLITGSQHVIERKGLEPYTVRNLTRLAFIGNETWIVPATVDERRFAVFEVGTENQQDTAFFKALWRQMEGEKGDLGGLRALFDYLSGVDLSAVDLDTAPQTAALLKQKEASLDLVHAWLLDSLREGELVEAGAEIGDAGLQIRVQDAYHAFIRYCRSRGSRARVPDIRTVGQMIKDAIPSVGRIRQMVGGTRSYYYVFPPLEQCRREWDAFIKAETDWL